MSNQRKLKMFAEFKKSFDQYCNIIGDVYADMTQEDIAGMYDYMVQDFPNDKGLLEWWLDFEIGYKSASTLKLGH